MLYNRPKLFRMAVVLGLALACEAILAAQPSVLTWHNDSARTGQNLQETTLTPANVKSSTFGKLFVMNVDGKVDAQPLYVAGVSIPGMGTHNVLYVATENDSVYALNRTTGKTIWRTHVGTPVQQPPPHGCGNIYPLGITGTPIYDAGNGLVYAVAEVTGYHHMLVALDATTGALRLHRSLDIPTSSNQPSFTCCERQASSSSTIRYGLSVSKSAGGSLKAR